MSRSTRALIATGAAVALLAGSGATFARWYDEQTIAGTALSTGALALTTVADSESWLINTASEDETADPTVTFNPATDKIVPGDVVTYTTKVTLTLEGKNLHATLGAFVGSEVESNEDITYEVTSFDCTDGANLSDLTEADNGKECTVTTTVSYAYGADNTTSKLPEYNGGTEVTERSEGWNQAEETSAVSLSEVTLILEQNIRPVQ